MESIALKNLIERKGPIIQKADKRNTVVITDRTKYIEQIKYLLPDRKFMQLHIEDKLINYIVNLDKLKDCFKVLKN